MSPGPVVVAGDYMLDVLVASSQQLTAVLGGRVGRRSLDQVTVTPGGAGTVARLIASGGVQVMAIGSVGKDRVGRLLRGHLLKLGVDVRLLEQATDHESRVRIWVTDGSQPLMRFDVEPHRKEIRSFKWADSIDAERPRALVIADFGKNADPLPRPTWLTSDILTIVSARPPAAVSYSWADVLVVGHHDFGQVELRNGARVPDRRRQRVAQMTARAQTLRRAGCLGDIVATGSDAGLVRLDTKGEIHISPASASIVRNEVGAGDTFVAALTVKLLGGEAMQDAIEGASRLAARSVESSDIALVSLAAVV